MRLKGSGMYKIEVNASDGVFLPRDTEKRGSKSSCNATCTLKKTNASQNQEEHVAQNRLDASSSTHVHPESPATARAIALTNLSTLRRGVCETCSHACYSCSVFLASGRKAQDPHTWTRKPCDLKGSENNFEFLLPIILVRSWN